MPCLLSPFARYDLALETESVWKFHSNTMDPPTSSLCICYSICLWDPFATSVSPISHLANTSSKTQSIPLLSKPSWFSPKQIYPISSLNYHGTSFVCLLWSLPHCNIVTCGRETHFTYLCYPRALHSTWPIKKHSTNICWISTNKVCRWKVGNLG